MRRKSWPGMKGRGRAKALKNVLGVGGFRESHTNQTEFFSVSAQLLAKCKKLELKLKKLSAVTAADAHEATGAWAGAGSVRIE